MKNLKRIDEFFFNKTKISTPPKELNKEQRTFFEKMQGDENFEPKPEKSDKSFFEKVKDMFA